MNERAEAWFELAADGDQVELKTFIPSRIPGNEPGFVTVRINRLKALHLAINLLTCLAVEMRASGAAFEVPGVMVEKPVFNPATGLEVRTCVCGTRQWCSPGHCDNEAKNPGDYLPGGMANPIGG